MRSEENDILKYETENWLAGKLIQSFQKKIIDILSKTNYQSLHEVGCGQGYNMQLISSVKEAKCSGSDISKEALSLAQKRNPLIPFYEAPIYNLPFSNNSFDLVVVSEVLEHLNEPNNALAEIKRITKKYCLLTVPNEPIWRVLNILRGEYLKNWGSPLVHINHWSKREFINLVSRYYEIDTVRTSLPWVIILGRK